MTNTDSNPFNGLRAGDQRARERTGDAHRRGVDPHWHQPTDRYATFSDRDFRLG